MDEPTWWTYFKRISGTEIGRVIAEAAGAYVSADGGNDDRG